jgi:hypothetical protein
VVQGRYWAGSLQRAIKNYPDRAESAILTMKSRRKRERPSRPREGRKDFLRDYWAWTMIRATCLALGPIGIVLALLCGPVAFSGHPEIAWTFAVGYVFVIGFFLIKTAFIAFREDQFTILGWSGMVTFVMVTTFGFLANFALLYKNLGLIRADNSSAIADTVDFFYFSVTTWATIGLGDIVPTHLSRGAVIVEALCSYFATGISLALLVHVTGKIYDEVPH